MVASYYQIDYLGCHNHRTVEFPIARNGPRARYAARVLAEEELLARAFKLALLKNHKAGV